MNFKFIINDIKTQQEEVILINTENTGFTKTFNVVDGLVKSITRFEEKLNNLEAQDGLINVFSKFNDVENNPKEVIISLVDNDEELFNIATIQIAKEDQVSYYGDFAREASNETNSEKFVFERVLEFK